jgi:F-type H+-transporting ATPase subunit b
MHFDWSTLALQTINLLVLCWLLHRFLYRPVLGLLDARRRQVADQLAEAAAAHDQARSERAALEAERSGLPGQRDALLAAAVARADRLVRERLDQAQHQAATLLEEGRRALALEQARALEDSKAATLDLATRIAGRLLAASPASIRAIAWIDLIEQHVAALPGEERLALCRQIEDGGPLRVVTADSLPAAVQPLWRQRLGTALGCAVEPEFAVDPALLGGAELFFPAAILRFSWKDALANLRLELEKADAAG